MSKENPEKNAPIADTDWLDQWEAEHRLDRQAAQEMLRTTFNERLAAWRQTHPDEDSWVIPFHYTHEDGDEFEPVGALWIPPEDVQNVINRVGSYIHMSAIMDMESTLYGTGIKPSLSICSRMDLTGEIPVAYINPHLLVASFLREQVEQDFGVRIRSS